MRAKKPKKHQGRAGRTFSLPDAALLCERPRGQTKTIDRAKTLDLARLLEAAFADHGVRGHIREIYPGPVVTTFEFAPRAGTHLSTITALSNDLTVSLKALALRIVAPIPGKAAIGIEVPNEQRELLCFRESIDDDSFAKSTSNLPVVLGKDVVGRPICVDLTRMPHLLIAGSVGSGKSVAMNGMICSLLFKAPPADVRMIMIDPKGLELSIYGGLPHLLLPVLTRPKRAARALQWAVEEMERRYNVIAEAGVRDIASYNQRLQKRGCKETPRGRTFAKMPYIVIIIDEFADLMMVAAREVESLLARIAQKARASGIHLLVSTHRPSIEIFTGLIKANFPSRIAFRLASRSDSQTVIDQAGAERLLGMGDMLFSDRGLPPKRIQGPLVTDAEIRRVVEHWKKQAKPEYQFDILKLTGDEGAAGTDDTDAFAYNRAVAIARETRRSLMRKLKRELKVDHQSAVQLVVRMASEGIFVPLEGDV